MKLLNGRGTVVGRACISRVPLSRNDCSVCSLFGIGKNILVTGDFRVDHVAFVATEKISKEEICRLIT